MRQPTLMEAARAFREKEGRTGTAQEVANFRLTMKPVSNRVAFFDFQCSAQKSVSILAVLGGDKRLRTAHEEASRIALARTWSASPHVKGIPFFNANLKSRATSARRPLPTMPAVPSTRSCTRTL